MTVGEFKSRFAEVIEQVKKGTGFAVTYGRKKQVVGYFMPEPGLSKPKRKLGLLAGNAKADFKEDFYMTDEELLG